MQNGIKYNVNFAIKGISGVLHKCPLYIHEKTPTAVYIITPENADECVMRILSLSYDSPAHILVIAKESDYVRRVVENLKDRIRSIDVVYFSEISDLERSFR